MKRTNLLLPVVLVVHLLLLILLRFTAWPEMTLWPYLLLKGWLPYRDIAMVHNPLLIFDLAIFFKIFGLSLLSLKIYTWTLILITDLLVYLIAKKLTGSRSIAVFSVLYYVLWQPFFEGNGPWFDLALAPVALLVFHFLWKKELFWSGIFLGLAVLIKQTAFWFIVPLIGQIWLMGLINKKNLSKLIIGGVIPLLGLATYLLFTGTLADFYFWAVKFGIFYLPKAAGQIQLPTIKQVLALAVPFGLIVPALLTLLLRSNRVENNKSLISVLLMWFIFSSLGTYPRWSLFHFQPALPFLAIIFGFYIRYINISYKRAVWIVITTIILIGTIYLQVRFYRLNWQKPDRFFEKETLEMALWLKENTKPKEKIFILNSWDNLYALSETLPATDPWVPTLPWYLDYPGIQDKIVSDLRQNKPRLVVFEAYKEEGLGSYKPQEIDKFLEENYSLKEIIADRFWVLKSR